MTILEQLCRVAWIVTETCSRCELRSSSSCTCVGRRCCLNLVQLVNTRHKYTFIEINDAQSFWSAPYPKWSSGPRNLCQKCIVFNFSHLSLLLFSESKSPELWEKPNTIMDDSIRAFKRHCWPIPDLSGIYLTSCERSVGDPLRHIIIAIGRFFIHWTADWDINGGYKESDRTETLFYCENSFCYATFA